MVVAREIQQRTQIPHAQLAHDLVAVRADGFCGQAQRFADLLVGTPFGHALQHRNSRSLNCASSTSSPCTPRGAATTAGRKKRLPRATSVIASASSPAVADFGK